MTIPAARLSLLSIVIVLSSPLGATEQPPRQVVVQGTGKVSAPPDQAKLWVQVIEEGPRIDTVNQQARQKMESVLKVLKGQGIADKDVQTRAYQVAPKMEWKNGRSNRVGYTVSNQVTVTVKDLKKAGAILSAVVDAGANSVNGPQFEIAQPQDLERQALKLAVQDAKAKAQHLADAAGASLGEVLSIQETGVIQPMPRPMMMKGAVAAMDSASEPIASGEEIIQVQISASFLLK